MLGKIYSSVIPYYDRIKKQISYKKRPVLIISGPRNNDYTVLPVSTVSIKKNLDPIYDVEVDPAKYPNRDLTGLVGYWLQDAVVKWSKDNAYLVQGDGYTTYQWGTDAWDKGIRPVITVPKVALYNS